MMRYTLYRGNLHNGDIIGESNNKEVLISHARRYSRPATVIDEVCGGIIFENKAQREINNSYEDHYLSYFD